MKRIPILPMLALAAFVIASLRSLLRSSTRFAVLAVSLCPAPHSSLRAEGAPNVLFIAVDDLNDWCGPMRGHRQARTPNLDRLAARGVFFDRAYCSAPSCNPSRVSLLTGISPPSSGFYVNEQKFRSVMPDAVTLPRFFTSQGYRVAGGGKIFHHGDVDPRSWPEYFNQPRDPVPHPQIIGPVSSHFTWQPLDEPDEAMGDYKVVSWAADWLANSANTRDPFFLAVGFYRPHMPLHVPRKFFDQFPLEEVQLPDVKEDDTADLSDFAMWLPRQRDMHGKITRASEWQKAVQAYLAAVAFFDVQLGRLLDALDASQARSNTIIVLWSDHGWHHGQKKHWSKFALWEQSTQVPLLVVAPGVTPAGAHCPSPVSLLDLFPTLTELCELPRPPEIEGQSLVPLLKDPAAARAEPAVMTWGPGSHAVRDTRWRYIRYRDGSEELYDHDQDPHEWTNLAGKTGHAETIARLAQWLPKEEKPLTTRTVWLPPGSVSARNGGVPAASRNGDIPVAQSSDSPGQILTEQSATLTGDWITSSKVQVLAGQSYLHDGNDSANLKTATFETTAASTGPHTVRLLFTPSDNRSTRTPARVTLGDQHHDLLINQQKEPQTLGPFDLTKGQTLRVVISNKNANGFVVVDALEIAPQ